MGRKYQVISGDGHVETPPDGWLEYVPDQYRDRAPRLIRLPNGADGWLVEGQPMLHNGQNIKGRGPVKFANASYFNEDGSRREGAGDAVQRLHEQDVDGIDAEVLFAPVFVARFIESISDKSVYRSIVSAYNTWLAADYCSVAPDRLIANALMPVSGLADALSELKRAKELGFRTVQLQQFPNGSGAPKPEDDQFWALSLELGIALSARPKLLLLDEPTCGMSPVETASTIELIQRLGRERKLTLLFTEHKMDVVFSIAERISVLHLGRLLAEGNPAEIRANAEVRRVYLGDGA